MLSPAISGLLNSTSSPIMTITEIAMAPAICSTGTWLKSAAAISLKMITGKSTK